MYSHYKFASPLANGVREFGMWLPNTDPSGSGLILPARFRGQEGAPADAPMHSHLGVLGVTGFLMQDIKAVDPKIQLQMPDGFSDPNSNGAVGNGA